MNQEHLKADFNLEPDRIGQWGTKLYENLHKCRVAQFEAKSTSRQEIINRSLQHHQSAIVYQELFLQPASSSAQSIAKFLEAQNPMLKLDPRIVCISDATGSMSSVWNNAKTHVVEMVRRISTIARANKSELKWVAYRDYSDAKRIESSPWSNDPQIMHNFIQNIDCDGGGDYEEAVELGLQEANKEKNVTGVILIADAPPHREAKGEYLKSHNVRMTTDYREQARLLASKNIPAFCFYMNEGKDLVEAFKEIATITGGKASLFSNADALIDVISETVLFDIGGEDMVNKYRKTYHS